MKMSTQVLSRIMMMLFIWAFPLSGQCQPVRIIAFPTDCHALTFQVKTYAVEPASPNFKSSDSTGKVDILCVGDSINVDSPIYTNGGDVIIWANKLTITATIDTRIYFNHSLIDYSENSFTSATGAPSLKHSEQFQRQLSENPESGTQYSDSFKNYYLTCLDCRKESKQVLMPQFPSGLIPSYVDTLNVKADIRDGFAPPDSSLDFANLRSGNVYAFFNAIRVAENLNGASEADPPTCPLSTTLPSQYAFNAGGARGGKGGAGTHSACITRVPYVYNGIKLSCRPGTDMDSGLTGPGGRGGDAGSVHLYRVGIDKQSAQPDLLKYSNTRGGQPGSSTKYRGPTTQGPLAATGDYCDFLRQPEGSWPAATAGADGQTVYADLNPSDAIVTLAKLLRAKEARFDYDLSELATRATDDEYISSISFDDYFAKKMALVLSQSQAATTLAVDRLLALGVISDKALIWPTLRRLDVNTLEDSLLSNRGLLFLRELSTFSGLDSDTASTGDDIDPIHTQQPSAVNPLSSLLSKTVRAGVARASSGGGVGRVMRGFHD